MRITPSPFIKACLAVMLMITLLTPRSVAAQSNGLIYTVQNGDTLDSIALSFHTTSYRIRRLNYIEDADYIYPGYELIIPGFDDVQGEAIRVNLPFGISLSSYFGSLHQGVDFLERLNFISSIDQTWAGAPLFIMNTDKPTMKEVPVTAGVTGLELAVKQGVSEWTPTVFNNLRGPLMLLPNTMLYLPDDNAIPGLEIEETPALSVSPFPLLQGKTTELIAAAPPEGATLSGSLGLSINDSLGQSSNYTPVIYPLRFFPSEDGRTIALQGVHRFTKPGFAPMVLTTTFADGSTFSMQQNLLVQTQDYGLDAALVVDPESIDPAITVPEWELIKSYIQDAPPEKQWINGFQSPSPSQADWISSYGRLRSFNGSEYIYFHSGIDFVGNEFTPIYAVAAGEVVYTGELDVRGGATIISHGWGVYSGYWHQSQINVKVGDHVEAGQTIGMVGDKGRVTGPHLHLEAFVGGVQVDPREWLQGMY